MRPSLLEAGERTLLYYWDKSGARRGFTRAGSTPRGASRARACSSRRGSRSYWPTLDRAPTATTSRGPTIAIATATTVAAPPEQRSHADGERFPRDRLLGGGPKKQQPQLCPPAIAIASNAIYVAYKLERGNQDSILLMRIPLTLSSLDTGLGDKPSILPDGGRADRELGDVEVVNEDRANADAPAIACGKEGCFIAWHGESGGAYAALIEPVRGSVLWRKRFAPLGGHPSLSTSASGTVEVAYYEKGYVRIATLTRDGVGPTSTVARIASEQPRPSIASGAQKNEWLVAWQDLEAGKPEAFAARVVCR